MVLDCLDQPTCEYQSFVTLGDPPQNCSYIAASWAGSQAAFTDRRCENYTEESWTITINHCCLKNDRELEFNPVLEDSDAQCFLADFDLIYECLICNLGELLPSIDCEDRFVRSARPDQSVRGTCYFAEIEFGFRYKICC